MLTEVVFNLSTERQDTSHPPSEGLPQHLRTTLPVGGHGGQLNGWLFKRHQ